jgi:(1->4)-alpha-D-glucan 1-alpha-D-glucosylmutase
VPAVGTDLQQRWEAAGGEPSYEAAELRAKRDIITALLGPEVNRLTSLAEAAADAAGAGLDAKQASDALIELLVHCQVYRVYLRLDEAPGQDALDALQNMGRRVVSERPDLAVPVRQVLALLTATTSEDPATRDLVVRFQQVCGPVMAKGVEDTTFYRWHRLIAMNEVGGDPRALDRPHRQSLHDWAIRQAEHSPAGMTALSTHDTKRNEDARAALLAAAGDLRSWDAVRSAVSDLAQRHDVDRPTGYLLAQTLMAAWPIDDERLLAYLLKAVREAKQHTSWNDPDEAYEERVRRLALACLRGATARKLDEQGAADADARRTLILASKLVQLTLPGVADTYQGTEFAAATLVDPDNRRPVDYDARRRRLEALDAAPYRFDGGLDADKLWCTAQALRLRRRLPEVFGVEGGYEPLVSDTPHVLAFLRTSPVAQTATVVTRWPGALTDKGWGDSRVALPVGSWRDILTGHELTAHVDGIECAELFAAAPVALLERRSGQ